MPLYEYLCPKCENRFDMRQSMKEVFDFLRCPECNSFAQRVFSLPTFMWGGKFKEDKWNK